MRKSWLPGKLTEREKQRKRVEENTSERGVMFKWQGREAGHEENGEGREGSRVGMYWREAYGDGGDGYGREQRGKIE